MKTVKETKKTSEKTKKNRKNPDEETDKTKENKKNRTKPITCTARDCGQRSSNVQRSKKKNKQASPTTRRRAESLRRDGLMPRSQRDIVLVLGTMSYQQEHQGAPYSHPECTVACSAP